MTISPSTPLPHIPLICFGQAAKDDAVIQAIKSHAPQFEFDRQDVDFEDKQLANLAKKNRIIVFDIDLASRDDALKNLHFDERSLIVLVGPGDEVAMRVNNLKLHPGIWSAIDNKNKEFVGTDIQQVDNFFKNPPQAEDGMLMRLARWVWSKK